MINEAEAWGKLLRLYRHDFLNILQVISGLAQLQKTDRLLAYIRKSSEEVQKLGHLPGCGDPRAALIIYETMAELQQRNCLFEVKGKLPLLSAESLTGLETFMRAFQNELFTLDNCAINIILSEEGPEFRVRLSTENIPETFWIRLQTAVKAISPGVSTDRQLSMITLHLNRAEPEAEE